MEKKLEVELKEKTDVLKSNEALQQTIDSLKQQIKSETNRATEAEKLHKALQSALTENKKQLEEEKVKVEQLQKKFQQSLDNHNKEIDEVSKQATEALKLQEPLQQILTGHQNGDHQEAHVSIELGTIFDLGAKGKGWKVTQDKPEKVKELMNKEIMTVGVLGPYDSGKTYVCNLLGDKNLRSGHQHRTAGIEIVYPEKNDVYFGLIDVPGSQEAHPVNDKKLIRKLPLPPGQNVEKESQVGETIEEKKDELKEENEDEDEDEREEDDDKTTKNYLDRYNLLHCDAKLMHSLKEQFIVENADMIIIVTNKLAESDQEMIYKILNYYREWYKRAKKATTQKYIYIVHNFKMLTSIEDVNNQIEKDML